MNSSSGIKRGLAATAISALAVTGLPALVGSATAAPTDVMNVVFTGPALNGGADGAVVVLKTKGVAEGDLDLIGANLTSSEDTATQSAEIVSATRVPEGGVGDSNPTDGFDEITVRIAVTTATTGDTATFAIYEDEDASTTVDATEPRAQVSVQTAGQLAQIVVSPSSQTSAAGVQSAPYTVTLKDSAGRTTQLNSGKQITIDPDGATTNESGNVITADEIATGSDTFRATGPTVDVYQMVLTSDTTPVVTGSATLDVVKSATITAPEVDVVTGADSWNGFGDGVAGGTTDVRVDQGSIRIDIRSTDAAADGNGTVTLNVSGTGLTFGGQATTTVSTVLDANGVGSLTITPDAGTVQEGDSFAISGSFAQTFQFERAAVSDIQADAATYVSAIDGSVTVSATVLDQFGLPVSSGEVDARRLPGGPNPDATPQRKPVGADGKVSFTFTDVNAVPGQQDTVEFRYYTDQFDATGAFAETTTIRYTVDGMGSDFTTRLDGVTASGAGYDPASVKVIPLADSTADDDGGNESADLAVVNGTPNAGITVSVDNGALILKPGQTRLSQGSASITTTLDGTGNLPAGYRIIGTKAGLTTVTITSANRTETAQFTVTGQSDATTARNVTVSGPATADAGDLVTFTAVVTDAFGNGIAGVPATALNVQVSGPAALQDSGAVTDASGGIALNVRVRDDAEGGDAVTVTVTGVPAASNQFGAGANQLTATSAANSGAGLPASANTGTASLTVNTPPPVVEPPVNPSLVVRGRNNGKKDDNIVARAINLTAGATVRLFRKTPNGLKLLMTSTMNEKGNHRFSDINDKNGRKYTKYVVKVEATDATNKGRGAKRVR